MDFILPDKNHPHYERALLHDLNLFAIFGGSIRNKRDWENLIAESGLTIKKFKVTTNNIDHEPNVPLCSILVEKE